jgi:hypothetical protein
MIRRTARSIGPKYTEKDVIVIYRADHNSTLEVLHLAQKLLELTTNPQLLDCAASLRVYREYLETKS